MNVSAYIGLMRPEQWVKNLFVLMPLFFSGRMLCGDLALQALLAFVAFCALASAIYCLNDLHDVEADRRHPRKRLRPLARGVATPSGAVALMCVLTLFSMGVAAVWRQWEWLEATLPVYLLLNVAYCLWLKRFAVIDVIAVALGYVLRLMAGACVCGVSLSPWIVLLTFMGTLFLAIAKRRDDLVICRDTGVCGRKSLRGYSMRCVDLALCLVASVTMVCYVLYTVSPEVMHRIGSRHVCLTSLFVLGGLLRYLWLAFVDEDTGSPTRVLLHDRFLQVCVAGWIVAFGMLIYV